MSRRYTVTALPKRAWVTMAVLGVVLPLILGSALPWILASEAKPGAPLWVMVGGPMLVAVVSAAFMGWGMRRLEVEIVEGTLIVRAMIYTRKLPLAQLDGAHARIIDLDQERAWAPVLRLNGVGLPGVQIGHFRGSPFRRRLFCLLTSHQRVLLIPELHGESYLLLSLEQPQRLLDALRM
ncbi:MAG: hypothetical protein KDI69_04110 [Xanthomonadales bacterium]|nr:hypothetical protein [Xanthomonadales bacterium]